MVGKIACRLIKVTRYIMQFQKSLKKHILKTIPIHWQKAASNLSVLHKTKKKLLHFPGEFSLSQSVLLILPEAPLDLLYQIQNIQSLAGLFTKARITALCRKDISVYLRNLDCIASIIEYITEERYLFSPAMTLLGQTLKKSNFDACILLERAPAPVLLHLIGSTDAQYRIGYGESGSYPFLNIHIKASSADQYIAENNTTMANTLGAPPTKPAKWTVKKEAQEEIAILLTELKIQKKARIIFLDGPYLFAHFDSQWVFQLCAQLKQQKQFTICCKTDNSIPGSELEKLQKKQVHLLPPLSISRTAAFIYRADYSITGNSTVFQLANLFHKKAIGILQEKSLQRYFKKSNWQYAATFSEKPDTKTINQITGCITETPVTNCKKK